MYPIGEERLIFPWSMDGSFSDFDLLAPFSFLDDAPCSMAESGFLEDEAGDEPIVSVADIVAQYLVNCGT